jgi:hypothetical protein
MFLAGNGTPRKFPLSLDNKPDTRDYPPILSRKISASAIAKQENTSRLCYNLIEPYLDVQQSGLSTERRMIKAMPTQEERLAAVEQNLIQFKTETVGAYQDMAMQMTMLKGLTETTIGRLASMQWQIDQRFNTVDTTFNEHKSLLTEILD